MAEYGWAFEEFVTEPMLLHSINAGGIKKLSPDVHEIEGIARDQSERWRKGTIVFSVLGRFVPEIRYEAAEE